MYEVMYEPRTAQAEFQSFLFFKEAMQFARQMAREFIDHVWVYYMGKDGGTSDCHWIIDPDGQAEYIC